MQSRKRAEADRLLGIAENLLEEKDLNAARDFALLAQETEPLLDGSDQIIAIIDVLIAADKRLNDNHHHHHWYSILQIDDHRTDDPEFIKQQYRRLELLLHPDKNNFSFSESAFKLVGDAWSVLSDPARKMAYDKELFEFSSNPEKKTTYDKELFEFLSNPARKTASGQKLFESLSDPARKFEFLSDPCRKSAYHKELFHILSDPDAVKNRTENKIQNHREKFPVRRNSSNEVPPSENLWTPCPYCYYLYEYPRVLEGYCLRCQNCDRAFQVVAIPTEALPPTVPGKDAYCCSWPYFPIRFTISVSETATTAGTPNPMPQEACSPSEVQPPEKSVPVSRKRGRPAKNALS